jgi:hypothetical protein
MAEKTAEILEVDQLTVVADAGYDSATEIIVNCLTSGIEAYVAGVEFDVCVPCGKGGVVDMLSYTEVVVCMWLSVIWRFVLG